MHHPCHCVQERCPSHPVAWCPGRELRTQAQPQVALSSPCDGRSSDLGCRWTRLKWPLQQDSFSARGLPAGPSKGWYPTTSFCSASPCPTKSTGRPLPHSSLAQLPARWVSTGGHCISKHLGGPQHPQSGLRSAGREGRQIGTSRKQRPCGGPDRISSSATHPSLAPEAWPGPPEAGGGCTGDLVITRVPSVSGRPPGSGTLRQLI